MADVKFTSFSFFSDRNKASVAEHFSAKHKTSHTDSFNLLDELNPTIIYTYPDFAQVEIFENSLEKFLEGINRIKNVETATV